MAVRAGPPKGRGRHILNAALSVAADYLELCKPRVVALMLLTALVGMLLVEGATPPALAILSGLAGIGACAGGAAVINHLLDARRDAVMSRTSHRPLPQGRVRPLAAWLFAAALCAGGFALLWLAHNPLAAVLTAAALLGYAFLYTLVLKPLTPQNIVIGGISGAMPPLLGWVAIGGDVHPQPLLLVALIFVWTPAHFWALAMYKPEDYENTGVPLLQLVHGEAYTRLSITLYASLTLGVSLLYFAAGFGGLVYLAGALGLGAYFLLSALYLQRHPSRAHAMRVFQASNWYLMLMFALLLADHWLAPDVAMLSLQKEV